jgi:hypothetical protein
MKKNSNNFVMDTDWIFQGEIDSEQKNYVLLSYFQKLNKDLEQIKMYPMFTELSLHLGNLQTLLNRNQILYIEKKLKSNGWCNYPFRLLLEKWCSSTKVIPYEF